MEATKSPAQLPPGNLERFEQMSTRWDVVVQNGVAPEALLDPAFWAHRAMKMKPFDEIRARAEDGTWLGLYVVLDSSRTWARVKCLDLHKLTTADVALTQASTDEVRRLVDAHKVLHRGPHKWSVVRIVDNAVLHQGEEQKDSAIAWLEAHARAAVGGHTPAKAAVPA